MDLAGLVRALLPSGSPPGGSLEPPPAEAVRLVEAYLGAVRPGLPIYAAPPVPGELPEGRAILELEPALQVGVVHAALDRMLAAKRPRSGEARFQEMCVRQAINALLDRVLARKLPIGGAELSLILERAGLLVEMLRARHEYPGPSPDLPLARLVTLAERVAAEAGLPPGTAESLRRLRPQGRLKDLPGDFRKLATRIDALLGTQRSPLPGPGEPWADALRTDLAASAPAERSAWEAVLAHARTGDSAKPSGKWLREAARLVESLGPETFVRRLQAWLPRVAQRRTEHRARTSDWVPDPDLLLADDSAELLKGLAWCCATVNETSVPGLLGDLAETCYQKVTWHGARCPRVANASVWALSLSPRPEAAAQLSRLKARVDNPSARKLIEKALEAAATRAGLTPADLEELSVPTFGLDATGCLRTPVGRFTAEVRLEGTGDAHLSWLDADGKPQKSVPAEVKRDHGEALKALRQTVKELQKLLPAQRDRVERLLITEREWPLAAWQERYLRHPLLAPFTQRLIWHFRDGDRAVLGIPHEGTLVDVQGRPLDGLSEAARVRLWHPAGFDPETVLRWRTWLEERPVTQPFKQAHREIYLLTDAELATHTYSNRFAAHILKQHQFKALCDQRGWSYRLQGGFDGGGAPMATRPVPEWDLSAEFWVEGVFDAPASLSESGICLYVTTDQVRFTRGRAALPLTEVPALAFTEVMRDVDLFVGVASVGNDPAWIDRGEGQFQDYWHSYSFGDLSCSAETRKQVLERLLPRLKIRDRCALDGKFLRVRGTLRTYKIHLGSGNILMEPNDQYLCIVPDRGASAREQVFLPFEGDGTLAVILSKAFLLAEDARIQDPSIMRQIRGRV